MGIIDELAEVLDLSDDDLALIWSEPDHLATPAPLTPAPLTPAPVTPPPVTPPPLTPPPLTPPPVTPLPQSGESQATQAAGSRVVAGVAVAEPEPAGIKGWLAELYDPANPWLGYLRATLTVIVLIILAWILVWALAELFGAVGEIWDGMWAEEV